MCKTHCGLWLVGWYDSGVTGRSSLCNRWARPAVFRLFRLIYSNKLWYPNLKVVPFLDVKTLGADQKSNNWKFEKKRGRFRPRTAWLRRYFASERKTKGGVISTLPNLKFPILLNGDFINDDIKALWILKIKKASIGYQWFFEAAFEWFFLISKVSRHTVPTVFSGQTEFSGHVFASLKNPLKDFENIWRNFFSTS